MGKKLTVQGRRELVDALRQRYNEGTRQEKSRILEEFTLVSGYHRKSAIRILNGSAGPPPHASRPPCSSVHDEAVHQALTVLWEASDRICGKRLKALLPVLLPALERHGHVHLDPSVRTSVLAMSAATIDRRLRGMRTGGSGQRDKRKPTAVQRNVAVRTFADWSNPLPGHMEMDLVVHCGERLTGSYLHTLALTDVASGWTECMPLLVRDGTLVVESVEALRSRLPFALRGLDVDNGSELLNDQLLRYCASRGIEFTRSRPYHKNDQAWIEQKNGSVVRRLVGYRRLEGVAAFEGLAQLYAAASLFVNFFQPSFKLKEKIRTGSRVVKRYFPPETPCVRLLAADTISPAMKGRLQEVAEKLDPLQLLEQIRRMQHRLSIIADGGEPHTQARNNDDLTRFLASLSTAWQTGEVRATHRKTPRPTRHWRTRPDPFESVWPTILGWLDSDPDQTAKDLLKRIQQEHPGIFPDGQLRTLQRRLKQWRGETAHRLVFGLDDTDGYFLPRQQ